MCKTALITGITGQDGTYLAELLLNQGYSVHGLRRATSMANTGRIDHLLHDPLGDGPKITLHSGDLTDFASIVRIIQEVQPDELYNLGAQSSSDISLQSPEYTANANALGTLRILEAIRILNLSGKTRFFQASTNELFGLVQEIPQRETTPFYPRNPYAAAKLYAYWMTVNYREAHSMFACNGILFNHESPVRGEAFVTRRIARAAARTKFGLPAKLCVGNLDALRDWGFAGDFAEAMWLMLQQEEPDDFIIATGESHSVRDFVEVAFKNVGLDIIWQGKGLHETGLDRASGKELVQVDPRYFRPAEVDLLQGDAGKACRKLGWRPKVSFAELVAKMVTAELTLAEKETK